ncbi:MAG: DnaJ C-terminal domain-containing protein [Myxococcota bacterium]
MVELSNIFEDHADGPKGPDLDVTVDVPKQALGGDDGVVVPVPAQLDKDGRKIFRAVSPHEPKQAVRLRLPADFPNGGTVRLRGQGGLPTSQGNAGDLYVKVRLVDEAQRPHWTRRAALLAAAMVVSFWIMLAVAGLSGWGLPD